MTAYPSTYPSPVLSGYSAEVASGVVRTDMPSHQAQRRVFNTMPHRFSLVFVMSVIQWGVWYKWATDFGYRWFEIDIPTMYAGQINASVSPVLVRFTSDVSVVSVGGTDVQISVQAEMAPSMIANYLGAL